MIPNGGSPEILVICNPDDPARGMPALIGLHDFHAHRAIERNNGDVTVLLHMEMSVHANLLDNDTVNLFLHNLPQKLILLLAVCVDQCPHTFSCRVIILFPRVSIMNIYDDNPPAQAHRHEMTSIVTK